MIDKESENMNSKIRNHNIIYFKPHHMVDYRLMKIGTQFMSKCRFFNVVHKNTRKFYKFVDYFLRMQIVSNFYNGIDEYFMTFKILDFSPYESVNDFYINEFGQTIYREPFVYGATIAGFPDDFVHKILYVPERIAIVRPVFYQNTKNEPEEPIQFRKIVEQVKKGIQTQIGDYFQKLSPDTAQKRINEQVSSVSEEEQQSEVVVKRRKSIDENEEVVAIDSNIQNTMESENFIDSFMDKSRLQEKKSSNPLTHTNAVKQGATKKDARLIYQQMLLKYGK